MLPARPEDTNKATFGHVLNIAGSVNFRGAAYLSTVSALRVGAGYAILAAIPPVIDAVSAQLPEAVYLPLPQEGSAISPKSFPLLASQIKPGTVCALGCGISALGCDLKIFNSFLHDFISLLIAKKIPLVLDADGLNWLAQSGENFHFDGNCVMTPHPMELARLLKTDVESIQKNREHFAQKASEKFHAIVLLKGHRTIIADGKNLHINETGNSALAKAGTGDCLTGMIAGFLAQKMSPFDAAVRGAKIHGLAGEFAAKEFSEYGVLASDLPKYAAKILRESELGNF